MVYDDEDGVEKKVIVTEETAGEDAGDVTEAEQEQSAHTETAESLQEKESNPGEGPGPSAEDTMRERLGLGYTGDPKDQSRKQQRLNKLFKSNSRNKRTIAVATAAGGVVAGIIVAILLALLPLKMEAIIKGVEAHYGASVQQAMDTGTEKLVSQYFAKYVLPALKAGTCNTTIDATCVSNVPGGNNPIQKTFRAYKEQKIERKLAERGVFMGKKNGKFYVTIDGNVTSAISNADMDDVINFKKSLFDMDLGSERVSRNEFRNRMKAEMREAMKDMSKRDRIYMRFKFGAFLESKYGVKRCWAACKLADNAADKVDAIKFESKFALANLVQRVVVPRGEEMGIVLGCVTAPATCGTDAPSREGDTISEEGSTRETKFKREMSARLISYRANYGDEAIETLLKQVDDIEKNGSVSRFIAQKALSKIFGSTVSDKIVGATNPVGWIYLATGVVAFIDQAPNIVKALSYTINVGTTAVPTYMAYKSTADELHTGGYAGGDKYTLTAAKFGSTASLLDNHDIDATQSPLYANVMGPTTANNTVAGILGGTAYAATASPDGGYPCEDGKGPRGGALVCPEEQIGIGNQLLNNIKAGAAAIPGWAILAGISKFANDNPVTDFFGWLGDHLGDLVTSIPGIKDIVELIGALISPLMNYISNKLISNILVDGTNSDKSDEATATASSGDSGLLAKAYAAESDTVDVTSKDSDILPSGARMFNIIAMGADASFNEQCQAQMGCKGVSDETSAMIREQYAAKQKESFQSKTFFARMFDTSTHYSFISRLALTMPTNVASASDNMATALTTPSFGFLGNALGGLFSDKQAAAAVKTDAFGIGQTAFPDADIDALGDFETFYTNNCEGDKFQSYTQSWLDDMKFDENTGQTVATRVNGCLYVQSMAQTNAGFFDSTLLPEEALNDGELSQNPGAEFVIGTYNQKGSLSDAKFKQAVDNIVNNDMDIVGTQETTWNKYNYYRTALASKNYGIFPNTSYSGGVNLCSRDTAIVYNKDTFEETGQHEFLSFPQYPEPAVADCGGGESALSGRANAPILWLRYKETGQIIIVMNTHNLANVQKADGVKPAQVRKNAADVYISKIKALKEENPDIPIFFTGDFNEGFSVRDSGNVTLDGDWKNLFYCMAINGELLISAEDNNQEYKCPRSGGSGVDYIYATPEVQVDWTKRIQGTPASGGDAASDHDVIYARMIVPSDAAAGGTINVASYNILHSNDQSRAYWEKRLGLMKTVLEKNKLDVIGMQEARPDQQKLMMTKEYFGDTYNKFPEENNRPDFSPNAVLYSKKYSLVKSGSKTLPIEYDNGKEIDHLVQVLLEDSNGGKFYFLSTHDPANVRPGSEATNNQSRIDNARFYAAHLKELEKDGYPIFLVGDFNSRYGAGSNDPSCIVTKSGVVRDSWEIYKNITGCATSRPIGNEIDRVYLSNNMDVSKFWIAKRGELSGNGSDHHDTIMVTAIFPGANDPKTASGSDTKVAGVRNFRDAAASSNVLKKGVLFRSGQLSALTPKGADTLSSLLGNNGTIIDVRTAAQRNANKDENVPGSKNTSIPIDGILDQEPMVTDANRRKQIAKALKAAANANGPVLVHCVSGKDRTGWIVAMIMYANGANNQQVMDEYMLSQEAFPTGVKQAWLNSGLSAARAKYGSINGYLKNGLGLTDNDLQKLRQKFGA